MVPKRSSPNLPYVEDRNIPQKLCLLVAATGRVDAVPT